MANPDPSPETRFQPGLSGNPGGKTAEQRRLEVEAAEMSARIRHKMVKDVLALVQEGSSVEQIKGEILKLLKDSEDRAFGTPKQTAEIGGDPENPLTTKLVVERKIVRAPHPDTDS